MQALGAGSRRAAARVVPSPRARSAFQALRTPLPFDLPRDRRSPGAACVPHWPIAPQESAVTHGTSPSPSPLSLLGTWTRNRVTWRARPWGTASGVRHLCTASHPSRPDSRSPGRTFGRAHRWTPNVEVPFVAQRSQTPAWHGMQSAPGCTPSALRLTPCASGGPSGRLPACQRTLRARRATPRLQCAEVLTPVHSERLSIRPSRPVVSP